MSTPPANPRIYHITHVDNLPGIAGCGFLWSDAERIARGAACEVVGMSGIKQRRLTELEVGCHRGTKVGEYVPFYFCPRSIMLYILHMRNHPELSYRGGQTPMVHLEADLHTVVRWADREGVRWAFSDRNAGTFLAAHYNRVQDLDRVNWDAVEAADFRDALVKEGKQAEFLVYGAFPWRLVSAVGVCEDAVARHVVNGLRNSAHRPPVRVEPGWYFPG